MRTNINVNSEINTLKRLLIHSPDSGLGKVVPSKAQDWLFEDIVHLETIRKKEYDFYVKLLLYFLDPKLIQGKMKEIDHPKNKRAFFKPDHEDFHKSQNVIELQWLLSEILNNENIRAQLIASVCAIENCTIETQETLCKFKPNDLAKVFISGSFPKNESKMIFAPIPNFIFTRDIGIVINKHVLLNKPAKQARTREALLAKYIFLHHPLFTELKGNIIELQEDKLNFLLPKEAEQHKLTLEGGDVMVISKDHVLIGVSERTSWEAAYQAAKLLFDKNVVKKVTVIRIPKKRDYMHIDTIFTQVSKNIWVMLEAFSSKAAHLEEANIDPMAKVLNINVLKEEKTKIIQFHKSHPEKPDYFASLEDLLRNISHKELGCKKSEVKIIFSGNGEFPYDAREQWTDSCNLLAIKEGVVLGYDRNDKTIESFKNEGFKVIAVADLLNELESGTMTTDTIERTFISMPSAELSRARGGFHCMSMPILRSEQ